MVKAIRVVLVLQEHYLSRFNHGFNFVTFVARGGEGLA
jgi:hypothetical protein